jgi:hypothetical protein
MRVSGNWETAVPSVASTSVAVQAKTNPVPEFGLRHSQGTGLSINRNTSARYSGHYPFLLHLNLKVIIQNAIAQAEMITWVQGNQFPYLQKRAVQLGSMGAT